MTALASEFRYETLISGDENLLAIEAANKVLEQPGDRFNPLFLFGPTGVGKSHILYALARRFEERYPAGDVLVLPAEEFADECDAHWQGKTTYEFRQQLWRLNALFIDDVHELIKRPAALEEIYHAFNRFVADGRQLVFTSRESPADLLNLSVPMRMRFQSGLVVHIEAPRERMMRELIDRQADFSGLKPSQRATAFLCREVRNARELRGVFNELSHLGNGASRAVSLEEVKSVVQKHAAEQLKISDVATVVCEYYGVDLLRVRSASRRQSLVQARQMAMYLIRELTSTPLTKIGRFFGGRDHTTVLYACRKMAESIRKDHQLAREARDVQALLRN